MSWVWQAAGGGGGGSAPAGSGWVDIYDVNMMTQPSQGMATAGAYVIDGKTWYAKSALSQVSVCSMVSGAGMRMGFTGSSLDLGSSGAYASRFMAMPISQITGLTFAKPMAIRARFNMTNTSQITAFIGVVDSTNDAAQLTAAQRSRDNLCGNSQSLGTVSDCQFKTATEFSRGQGLSVTPALPNQFGYGVMYLGLNQTQKQFVNIGGVPAGVPAAPALPSFGEMCVGNTASPSVNLPRFQQYSNMMIAFMVSSNSGATVSADLTRLTVSQPK